MDLTHRPYTADIEFRNVSYSIKVKKETKVLLDGISGKFRHGLLNCIVCMLW